MVISEVAFQVDNPHPKPYNILSGKGYPKTYKEKACYRLYAQVIT